MFVPVNGLVTSGEVHENTRFASVGRTLLKVA